jgi:hypothetical protein
MPATVLSDVVCHLRKAALSAHGAGLSDGQLLERFLSLGERRGLAWPSIPVSIVVASDLFAALRLIMGYFILDAVIFVLGMTAFLIGKVPLTRRRMVSGAAARVVGAILMIPLPLYLVACKQSHVSPLGSDRQSLDPLMPVTEGFVRLASLMAAFASLLAATVLAIVTSETRRREDAARNKNRESKIEDRGSKYSH